MRSRIFAAAIAFAAVCAAAAPASAQQVTKETLDGVTNFNRLETTVACAGAIKATAVPELKKMGFASIINLRQPGEDGAQIGRDGAARRQRLLPRPGAAARRRVRQRWKRPASRW